MATIEIASVPIPHGWNQGTFTATGDSETGALNVNLTGVTLAAIDAGSNGTAGDVDIFPATQDKGKLKIAATDNATDTITTITNAAQAGARVYTIPDAGADAEFVMSVGGAEGALTSIVATDIDAGKADGTEGSIDIYPTTGSRGKLTFVAANSAGNTTTTITNASQAAERVYTIPDAGASASFVLAVSDAVVVTDIDAGKADGTQGSIDIFPTTAARGKLSFTATDNAASDTPTTITNASQAGARTYTIPDAGEAASFVMSKGTSATIATLTAATITTLTSPTVNSTNITAGASGTAGTVNIYPLAGSKGKISITAANSAADHTLTIVNASMAAPRTITIPDPLGAASFVLNEGASTIGGVKTLSAQTVFKTATAALLHGAGTSGATHALGATAGNALEYYLDATHITGDMRGEYLRLYFSGAGGSGEALRAVGTINNVSVATGGTCNGSHISLTATGANAKVSGAANALRVTFGAAANVDLGGTCASIQVDTDFDTAATVPANFAFLRFTDSNTLKAANLLRVPDVTANGLVSAHSDQVMTHSIKCVTNDGTVFYLMATTTATGRA